jgi:hypothetical protein
MGGPALAEGFEADPAVVVGQGDVEELAELTVKVGESALGMVDGADADVAAAVEPVGEKAEGDAFAGAGLAGDEGKAAVVHGELDAAAKGVDGNRQSYSGGRQTRPDKSEYFFPFFAANLFTPFHTARNA